MFRIIISLSAFFILVLVDFYFYRQRWFNYSISPEGIPSLQSWFEDKPTAIKFWEVFSSLGGGSEMAALTVITFLCGSRPKFIYYLAAFSLDKSLVGLMKQLYHDPRPFMVDTTIHAYHCSKEFGNPSGHSSAAALIATLLYLDIGQHLRPAFKYPSLFIAMFWALAIPFSRYLLGVHSLDQVVYGFSLGLWSAITLHFVLREPIIKHATNIMATQRTYLNQMRHSVLFKR
jgi:membrane-associated phospholipid phosphatase